MCVLRDTLLGDIHAAQDLETGNKRSMKCGGKSHKLDKVAVYTDTDNGFILEWLDMYIRCVLTLGILDDSGSKFNDRSVLNSLLGDILEFLKVKLFLFLLCSFVNNGVNLTF